MKILAIESATTVCSVALDVGGRVCERVVTAPARAEDVFKRNAPDPLAAVDDIQLSW